MTLFWTIVIILAVGIIWYTMAKKKNGGPLPKKPEEPTPPPSETPTI